MNRPAAGNRPAGDENENATHSRLKRPSRFGNNRPVLGDVRINTKSQKVPAGGDPAQAPEEAGGMLENSILEQPEYDLMGDISSKVPRVLVARAGDHLVDAQGIGIPAAVDNSSEAESMANGECVLKRSRGSSSPAGAHAAKRPRLHFVPIPLVANAPHEDLDAPDTQDPLMVSEYVEEIFALLYRTQEKFVIDPSYMDRQPELHWRLRGILINWLVTVHSKFRLVAETLLLAVNIIDRYLERRQTPLCKLQLVGITALFIAAKYEEVFSPSVQNYSYVAKVTGADILDTERSLLNAIGFDLSYANPMNFLRRISKADDYNVKNRTVAKYLIEVASLEPQLLPYRASDVAAAAMCLAKDVIGETVDWTDNLVFYSGGCTQDALRPLMVAMLEYLAGPIEHSDFFRKYSSKKFLKASILCRNFAKEHLTEYMSE